jgi:hypothetical protein
MDLKEMIVGWKPCVIAVGPNIAIARRKMNGDGCNTGWSASQFHYGM